MNILEYEGNKNIFRKKVLSPLLLQLFLIFVRIILLLRFLRNGDLRIKLIPLKIFCSVFALILIKLKRCIFFLMEYLRSITLCSFKKEVYDIKKYGIYRRNLN